MQLTIFQVIIHFIRFEFSEKKTMFSRNKQKMIITAIITKLKTNIN